ncbi:MAG: PilN domain-containing protein [Candidatus Melainabacteria bacterium]|nr:PilN domain-containing protein [Candidatus Melainabacteria bacterium]
MEIKLKKNHKYNKLISIELSENNLIATEVQFVKNKIYITGTFTLNIPILQDINQTISLIKEGIKKSNIKTKDTVIGLSMQYFKLFPVPLPATIPLDEIDQIILQEGNIDLNNNCVSWLPLKNTQRQETDGITRYDVLGISAQKAIINIAFNIAKKCGLKLVSVTPSFLGVGAFLSETITSNLTATLWVSQIRSELVIWTGQEPIYEHLFLTHQLNEQVFQSINLIETQLIGTKVAAVYVYGPNFSGIDKTKVPYNLQSFTLPPDIVDSGKILQKNNINEIIASLGLALAASNNTPYLVPNLLIPIKSKTKIDTIQNLKNVFKDLSKSQKNPKKGFKLPFKIDSKYLDPQLTKYITCAFVVFFFSFLISFFIQSFLMPGVVATQSLYENKITLAQIHLNKLLNFEKANKIFKIKNDYFSSLIDKRMPWSRILQEVAKMTPKELWIDRLEIKNNNIDIFGRALNVDAVANFSINLNYTAMLLGKAQIIALKKFDEEGIEIIEFQVSSRVNEKEKPYKKNNSDVISDASKKT